MQKPAGPVEWELRDGGGVSGWRGGAVSAGRAATLLRPGVHSAARQSWREKTCGAGRQRADSLGSCCCLLTMAQQPHSWHCCQLTRSHPTEYTSQLLLPRHSVQKTFTFTCVPVPTAVEAAARPARQIQLFIVRYSSIPRNLTTIKQSPGPPRCASYPQDQHQHGITPTIPVPFYFQKFICFF